MADMTEKVFIYERKARYYETDQMGVIHHSNYIRWMEEARIEMMNDMGLGYKRVEEQGIVSPTVSVSVEYKNSVCFDDIVEIRVYVKKYTGVSLVIGYEMYNRTKGEICTTAESKHCFTEGGKLVSLKRSYPELDKAIKGYCEEDVG